MPVVDRVVRDGDGIMTTAKPPPDSHAVGPCGGRCTRSCRTTSCIAEACRSSRWGDPQPCTPPLAIPIASIAIDTPPSIITPSSFMMGRLQVLDVPSALVDEIRSSGLPSATLPSDHLCLVAGFRVGRSAAPADADKLCSHSVLRLGVVSRSRMRDVHAIVMRLYGCSWMMAACTAAARPSRCPWLPTPCCTESACPPR